MYKNTGIGKAQYWYGRERSFRENVVEAFQRKTKIISQERVERGKRRRMKEATNESSEKGRIASHEEAV